MATASTLESARRSAQEAQADPNAHGLRFEVQRGRVKGPEGGTLAISHGDTLWLRAGLQGQRAFVEDALGARSEAPNADEDYSDASDWLEAELAARLDRRASSDENWGLASPPSKDRDVGAALAAALDELRNPILDLDGLQIEKLRRRISEKWATYPSDILPAWVAEMDFPLAEPVRRVLAHAASEGDVGYPLGLRETRIHRIFAERMEKRFEWTIDPARIEVLSEVVQAMHVAMHAFSEPGDGVIVQTPIYPPFLSVVRDTQRRLVENRLVAAEAHAIDFEALSAAADSGTRVAFLCNPHNPTGRAFRREELERIAELAIERDWVVVMDEIHADLVFDGARHIPLAALGPEIAAQTVTLTSASKAFNIPGLRCSVAHFGSAELQQRFNQAADRHVRGGLGLLGLYATVAAWKHSDPWLRDVRALLERNRDRVQAFVAERLPKARMHEPQATYLAWIDFSAYALPTTPAKFLARHAKVALSDGPNFGSGLEGYARLNFATSGPILEEILERIARALDEHGS